MQAQKYPYNGKTLYIVRFEGNKDPIDKVELNPISEKKLGCKKCKSLCSDRDCKLSRFECRNFSRRLQKLYLLLTSIIIVCLTINIFNSNKIILLQKIAVFVIAIAVLDMIFSTLESKVPKFWYDRLYKKVKKLKEQTDKEIKESEEKKEKEELERLSKMPYYQNIVDAEARLNSLKDLSNKCDFGETNESVSQCVKKLFEILNLLKEDSSGYNRVAYLFEAYLPELYNTLVLYNTFAQADAVKDEQKEVLKKCVGKFLAFLEDQRVEALFDKKYLEMQFKATAENLGRMIDKGEEV